jgi:ATP-dependent DNA helicase RecQ
VTSSTEILHRHFGYSSFRPGQQEIVDSIIAGQDILALLPTGGGKSVCFQVPGLAMNGTTVVISPLISLMKDQVDALVAKKISATYINSSLTKTEIDNRFNLLESRALRFIYVAPERLLTRKFLQSCKKITISLVAVDEAHCISQWGHDFRPEYMRIATFISELPLRPIVAAFTATATSQVQDDIVQSLQLVSPRIFFNSFRRDNLRFHTVQCPSTYEQELALFRILRTHHDQSGVIYASTQKMTEYLVKLIHHYAYNTTSIAAYHAGLSTDQRSKIQDEFLDDTIKVITATNAFGMGVDKPNVRFVIHFQVPGNLENYYQEAGRAGRDGEIADCYLLFNQIDIAIQQTFIEPLKEKSGSLYKHKFFQLKKMIDYSITTHCLQQEILKYFNEHAQPCEQCSCCLHQFITASPTEKQQQIRLQTIQRKLATRHSVSPEEILTKKMIELLALHQPHTPAEYIKIAGIGYGWLEKWYNPITQLLEKGAARDNDITTTR